MSFLSFQFFQSTLERLEYVSNLFLGVPWRNVLLAVPVKGFDFDYVRSFNDRMVASVTQPFDPLFCRVAFENLRAPQNFNRA